MADTTIVVEPSASVPVEDEEISWQSVLSEIRQALENGFSSLRTEFASQLETLRNDSQSRENRLLESNTNLTSMITIANQTLMEKVTSLTLNPSPVITVVEEPIAEPIQENVEAENLEAVTSEEPVETARRKRRTL